MVNIDIITYATNYSYEVFDRFVGSLNDTGFAGNIYIITKECDIIHIEKLKIKYNNVNHLLDELTNDNNIHLNNHRFFVINKYLNILNFKSTYILICDFRDVLFQKNIELYPYDDTVDLYGFLEGIKIFQDKNCNTPWLKELETIFNETFYDQISNEYVICCGTTLGKIDAIKQYVSMMCNYILKHNIKINLDQGIHNYMFYVNKFNNINIKLLSNQDNLVNTIGCDIKLLNENNNIVNKDNNISYIVHQYDRCSNELKEKISNKYGYNFMC